MYPEYLVSPMRQELVNAGFEDLRTPEEVDQAIKSEGTVLVMVNSVCGCAARSARPGAILSMLNGVVPDEYVTLFAGMEKEAVDHFRKKYLQGLTPSSPNIALFKNGQLLHILQRYQVEGRTAGEIAKELAGAFDKICNKKNSPEEIDKLKKYIVNRYQVSIESLNT